MLNDLFKMYENGTEIDPAAINAHMIRSILFSRLLILVIFIILIVVFINRNKLFARRNQQLASDYNQRLAAWERNKNFFLSCNENELKNIMVKRVSTLPAHPDNIYRFVLFVIPMVLLFPFLMFLSMLSPIIPVIIFGIAIVAFLIISDIIKKKRDKDPFKEVDLEFIFIYRYVIPALMKIFNDNTVTFSSYGNIRCQDIIPVCDKCKCINQISTTYNGRRISFADLNCQRQYSSTDINGNTTVEYKDIWTGQVYELDSVKQFYGHTRIVPTSRNLINQEVNTLYRKINEAYETKVETDNIWFNEHFDVYTTDKTEALYFLSPSMIEFLSNMCAQRKAFTVCIENGKIYVADPGRMITERDFTFKANQQFIYQLNSDAMAYNNAFMYSCVKQMDEIFNKS